MSSHSRGAVWPMRERHTLSPTTNVRLLQIGKCQQNYGYMKTNCAPMCGTCEQLSDETRCPYDKDIMPDAWKPGDLNQYFTNLTTLEQFRRYEPKVLSRPEYLPGDSEENADYILGPWIVT